MIASRPRSIAEIFDRAVTLTVRRWVPAVTVAVIAAIPNAFAVALVVLMPGVPEMQLLAFPLQIAAGLMLVFATVALVTLFAGESDRPEVHVLYGVAFRSFWRYVGVALMSGLLLVGIGLAFAIVFFIASAIAGRIGAFVVGVAAAAAGVPLYFVVEVALAGAALDGTGASASIGNAFRRALRDDQRIHTAKLAFAAVLCYLVPQFVIVGVLTSIVALTQQLWLAICAGPLQTVAGLIFFTAVLTLAAIDYQVRTEGADLEAALDAVQPA